MESNILSDNEAQNFFYIQNLINAAALAANNKSYKKSTVILFELIKHDQNIIEKIFEHVLESLKLWGNSLGKITKDLKWDKSIQDKLSEQNATGDIEISSYDYDINVDIQFINQYYKKLICLLYDNDQKFNIFMEFASFLQKMNLFSLANLLYLQAIALQPKSSRCKIKFEKLNGLLVARWHYRMLNDCNRNKAFKLAIQYALDKIITINSGVFLDIGAGSGLLSLYAAKYSEKFNNKLAIYSCEMDSQMQLIAKDVIADNMMTNRISFIEKHSEDILVPNDLSLKANILVTETFDAGLLGEHVLKTLKHSHEFLIQPLCTIIPAAATIYLVPVQCCEIRSSYGYFPAKILSMINIENIIYASSTKDFMDYDSEKICNYRHSYKILSEPQILHTICFSDYESICKCLNGIKKNIAFKIFKSGTVDALVMWFDLNLYENLDISTSPMLNYSFENYDCNSRGISTCWEQAIFPVNFTNCSKGELALNPDDILQTEWTIGDGVILNNCYSFTDIKEKEDKPTFIIDQVLISAFNSELYMNYCVKSITAAITYIEQMQLPPIFAFIGESNIPCAIIASRYGQVMFDNCEHKDLFYHLTQINQIKKENMCLRSNDTDNNKKISLLMVDLIDIQGYFKYEAFEIIVNRRSLYNFIDAGIIIPHQVNVIGMLINCQELFNNSLVNDNACSPFKIATHLNKFKMVNYHNIELSTLPHARITDPFHIFDINMYTANLTLLHKTVSIQTTQSGTVDALVYWFEVYMFDDVAYSTVDQAGPWRQSAVLLESRGLVVDQGNVVDVEVDFWDGLFLVECTVSC